MAQVITIASDKGGVGKTTVAIHLAAGLASYGRFSSAENPYRVLLIDMDPSGNALDSVGYQAGISAAPEESLYHLLTSKVPPSVYRFIRQSDKHPNLSFIPTNHQALARLYKNEIKDLPQREYRLARALRSVMNDYDFIIIDTPPAENSGFIMPNALAITTGLVIPAPPQPLEVKGMQTLISEMEETSQELDRQIPLLGIVPTIVDASAAIQQGYYQALQERFGDLMFPPSHRSQWIPRGHHDHIDLFAAKPRFWETFADAARKNRRSTPVEEFGEIVIELLRRLDIHENAFS